jgi:hypothetical protein
VSEQPLYPWRIDTNDRYRELVSLLVGLSTAALLLPAFVIREYLGIPANVPMQEALPCTAYLAWIALGTAIVAGIAFHFFSAKWARLAWGKPVSVLACPVSEKFVERSLECSLWLCVGGFISGVTLILVALVTNVAP